MSHWHYGKAVCLDVHTIGLKIARKVCLLEVGGNGHSISLFC